jgi:hypothetical protein
MERADKVLVSCLAIGIVFVVGMLGLSRVLKHRYFWKLQGEGEELIQSYYSLRPNDVSIRD